MVSLFQILRGFPDSSVGKDSTCNAGRPWFNSWVRKIPWRRDRLPTLVFLGFPCGSVGKESGILGNSLGGPVVKTLCVQCRECRFNPWLVNYDSHVPLSMAKKIKFQTFLNVFLPF